MAAELGPESLSAYVISMATNASDVLAVELLKREASLVVCTYPRYHVLAYPEFSLCLQTTVDVMIPCCLLPHVWRTVAVCAALMCTD